MAIERDMYRFMDEENGNGTNGPKAGSSDQSLISMRNIWKTYQMGV